MAFLGSQLVRQSEWQQMLSVLALEEGRMEREEAQSSQSAGWEVTPIGSNYNPSVPLLSLSLPAAFAFGALLHF